MKEANLSSYLQLIVQSLIYLYRIHRIMNLFSPCKSSLPVFSFLRRKRKIKKTNQFKLQGMISFINVLDILLFGTGQ
jgi:hypothetical protein